MSARVNKVETGERSAAAELGLVAGLIAVAIFVALAATGGPILDLLSMAFGFGHG